MKRSFESRDLNDALIPDSLRSGETSNCQDSSPSEIFLQSRICLLDSIQESSKGGDAPHLQVDERGKASTSDAVRMLSGFVENHTLLSDNGMSEELIQRFEQDVTQSTSTGRSDRPFFVEVLPSNSEEQDKLAEEIKARFEFVGSLGENLHAFEHYLREYGTDAAPANSAQTYGTQTEVADVSTAEAAHVVDTGDSFLTAALLAAQALKWLKP